MGLVEATLTYRPHGIGTEEGIPAIADRQDINMVMGGLRPVMWGYGPKVRIRPKDLPRAKTWLEVYEQRRKSKQEE